MAPRIVLVVDPHDDSRIAHSTTLQYGGCIALEARTGPEALTVVPQHTPDAMITEPALPVIDGCEVLDEGVSPAVV